MNDKVEGLCAPTAPAVQRKVKGYIFSTDVAGYYSDYGEGQVTKAHAYMYSMAEIKQYFTSTWGHKDYGKWIIVYE